MKKKNNNTIKKTTKKVAEAAEQSKLTEGVLTFPVVRLYYPLHGTGDMTKRIVKVTEMDEKYIKGFELESEFDEEPGKPRTYIREKANGNVLLLHFSSEKKN